MDAAPLKVRVGHGKLAVLGAAMSQMLAFDAIERPETLLAQDRHHRAINDLSWP
jgi:hypothetical protein